ncbi:MAG: hypothetical protein DWH91_01350 [Planctomycetota bacterium]|nr:MAG: hypothetical protein DWH91_01350 [Planctomycetota bacterium]
MTLRDGWLLIVISGLAIALRLAVMGTAPQQLTMDRDLYLGLAEQIQAGNGYSTPGIAPSVATAFRPPLYPLLLAGIPHTPWAIGGLHLLLAVGMGWAVARAILGAVGELSWGGYIAALVVAVDPLLVAYAGMPMTETLCAALSAVLLWRVRFVEAPRSEGASSAWVFPWRGPFVAGVWWGLCVLARPTYLAPWGLWLACEFLVAGFSSSTQTPMRRVARAGVCSIPVAVGMFLVLAPWMIRNQMVWGKPIATTTHGGYTLWLANNPVFFQEVVDGHDVTWQGESLARWQAATAQEMRVAGINGEIAQDRWQAQRARQWIAGNPTAFLRAMGYRARSFWALSPSHSSANSPILVSGVRLYYGGLWILAVLAVGRLVQVRAWSQLVLPLSLIAGFSVVHLVYWTDTRMRAPVMPAIAVLIGAAMQTIPRRDRTAATIQWSGGPRSEYAARP